jgi:hypothetical protein
MDVNHASPNHLCNELMKAVFGGFHPGTESDPNLFRDFVSRSPTVAASPNQSSDFI